MLERMGSLIVAGTLVAGCARAPGQNAPTPVSDTGQHRAPPVSVAGVRSLLSALADDSMQGGRPAVVLDPRGHAGADPPRDAARLNASRAAGNTNETHWRYIAADGCSSSGASRDRSVAARLDAVVTST